MSADLHGPRTLTPAEHNAVAVVTNLVGLLGLVGFLNSFARVQTAARPSFGGLAFTVPLGIDLGIAVFAALDVVLARLDMRIGWLRLVPWTLTGVTVYLNVAGEPSWFGRVAHAALPGLWVVAVEVGAHALRRRARLSNASRMEGVRRSRWILAPLSTARLRRSMILWEQPVYRTAIAREAGRLVAVAALRAKHGRLWRVRAPLADRLALKLDGLTAEGGSRLLERITPVEVPRPPAAKVPRPGTVKVPRAKAVPVLSEVALLAAAKAVNEDAIKTTGKPAGVPRLAAELGIGKPRATLLRDLLAAKGAHVNGTPVPAGATASTTIPTP